VHYVAYLEEMGLDVFTFVIVSLFYWGYSLIFYKEIVVFWELILKKCKMHVLLGTMNRR